MNIRSLLAALVAIIVVFIVAGVLDVVLSALYARFYTNAAFIVIFGVGGVFAAVYGYTYGMKFAPVKNGSLRWGLVTIFIVTGLFFFFFLAKLEESEYEAAFKAFGVGLGLGSLLFVKGKPDE